MIWHRKKQTPGIGYGRPPANRRKTGSGFPPRLEESLKLYEEGVKLTAFCDKELKGAKLKISELKAPQGETDETDE